MPANEWYEAHKAEVATALKKGKAAPKDRAVACTMVRMRDGSHLLCAAVNASKASAMVREARQAGGKMISAGQLFLDDDKVVFEVSEGALPAKAKFTDGGAAAGVPLGNAVFRPAPGAALVEEGAPPPPPQTTAPADGTAAVKEALSRLVPTVQQAVKDHPERKTDLLQPIARCKQQIESGHADEAKAALKEVILLLKGLGPTANSPPPPSAPPPAAAPAAAPAPEAPPAPAAPPPSTAGFMAQAKALKGEIDGVQAADPARAAELSKLLLTAAASAKAQDLPAAQATLDALRAALAAPAAPAAAPPPPAVEPEAAEAEQTEPSAPPAKAKGEAMPDAGAKAAVARWNRERTVVVAKVKNELNLVKGSSHPDAAKAELQVTTVLKQLNAPMETRQQAVEMERYLEDDDVVADISDLAFDLKTVLLKVLEEIKPQLPAA